MCVGGGGNASYSSPHSHCRCIRHYTYSQHASAARVDNNSNIHVMREIPLMVYDTIIISRHMGVIQPRCTSSPRQCRWLLRHPPLDILPLSPSPVLTTYTTCCPDPVYAYAYHGCVSVPGARDVARQAWRKFIKFTEAINIKTSTACRVPHDML